MHIETLAEVKENAHAKWREYLQAAKETKDPLYFDLKRMYWQIKKGKILIDIAKIIKAGGVIKPGYPHLAICRAEGKKVRCDYFTDGTVQFKDDLSSWKDKDAVVHIKTALPSITFNQAWRGSHSLEAPVPMIPPKLRPKILGKEHFILWEVEAWEMLPPTDPYLLRRITKTVFAVLAQWDLTPLERAAMAGRMH
jgi:hypothetical protein